MRLIIKMLLATGAVASGVAVAADMPSDLSSDASLVTAQKRAENAQIVPLSMTTFSAAALQHSAISTFFDYATKVPNLAFAPTGDGIAAARTVSIRGISGGDLTGMYLDDTPLPESMDPRLLDIERIEVLRGPQGTLYGARSMGGTVRLLSKPVNLSAFEGTAHVGLSKTSGTGRANVTGDTVLNFPLITDRVALRLSGFYDRQAGYFKRSYCADPAAAGVNCFPLSGGAGTTTEEDVGATETSGAAATLTIKVNDDFTITPRVMTQTQSTFGFPLADVLSAPGNGVGYPFGPFYADATELPTALKPSNFSQARWFNVPEGSTDRWHLYSLGLRWHTSVGDLTASTSYYDRIVRETEDQTDYVWGAITSNFGGLADCGNDAVTLNYCSLPQPGAITSIKDYQRFTEEVRFVSALTGPMQFILGGYYSNLHGRLPGAAQILPAQVAGFDDALGGPNNPDYANLLIASDYHTKIEEPALFGEVSYQPIPSLKVTVGARWTQVKTSAYGYQEGYAVGGPAVVDAPLSTTESNVSPKAQVDYHFADNRMVYATVAKGFRPGGLVPSMPAGEVGTPTDCAANLQDIDPNLTLEKARAYKADTLWNYEVGTKTSWLNNRLTLNAAAFLIKWKDVQQQIQLSCGYQYRANAGAAESKGGELEVRAQATQHLELAAGVGYQKAQITEASDTSPQTVGSPLFQVPDWTGNASAAYHTRLNSEWALSAGLDLSYIGRSFSGNNTPMAPRERPAYHLIDARFALTHGGWEYALVGKNLSNERANLGDYRSFAAEAPGRPRLFVNQPRTIGVEVRTTF